MRKQFDPSNFFNSPDSWNLILPVFSVSTTPLSKFNKLELQTKFSEPFVSAQLNPYFAELVHLLQNKDIKHSNELILGFLEIIIFEVGKSFNFTNTSFFHIAKCIFSTIFKKYQKLSSLLNLVAVLEILSTNLPITISLPHLCYLKDSQARLIHKYFSDEADHSIATKCLALSLVFPSARFTSDFLKTYKLKVSQTILLMPDPNVMLENSIDFHSEDLFYASMVVQYSHSLIFSIGYQPDEQKEKVLGFHQALAFQNLVTHNHLSLGSLCHSLFIFTTQPSTMTLLQYFLKSMKNLVGIELIKELFTANTTFSFSQLLRTFGSTLVSFLIQSTEEPQFENNVKFNQAFLDTLLPFHPDLRYFREVLSHLIKLILNEKENPNVLHFLGTLYSCFLRFSITHLSLTYVIIIEHYYQIAKIIYVFFEMLIRQPQLKKSEITRLNLNIISLLFESINKLEIRSFTSSFLIGFFHTMYYLLYVKVPTGSFLYYDLQKVVKHIQNFVVSNERILFDFIKTLSLFYVPSYAVVVNFSNEIQKVDSDLILKIIEYAVISNLQQIFYITKSVVVHYSLNNTNENFKSFLKSFFDLSIKYISSSNEKVSMSIRYHSSFSVKNDEDNKRQKLIYYLLLYEILISNEAVAVNEFVHHPFFPHFYAEAQFLFANFPTVNSLSIAPLISIFDILWNKVDIFEMHLQLLTIRNSSARFDGDPDIHQMFEMIELAQEEKIPNIRHLLRQINSFKPFTVESLLSIVTNVSRKLNDNPYKINFDDFVDIQSHNDIPKTNEHNENAIPWYHNNYQFDYLLKGPLKFVVAKNIVLPEEQLIQIIDSNSVVDSTETYDS